MQRGGHGQRGVTQVPLRSCCAQLWCSWAEEEDPLCTVQGAWHGESVQEPSSQAAPAPNPCGPPSHDAQPPRCHDGWGARPPPSQHGSTGEVLPSFDRPCDWTCAVLTGKVMAGWNCTAAAYDGEGQLCGYVEFELML